MADRHDDQPSEFRQRGFVAATALLAFLAIATLALVLTGNDDQPPSSAGTLPMEKAVTGVPAPAPTRGCPKLPASSQQVPTSAPSGARWELVGKVAAPSSSAEGPTRTVKGIRSCFARNPRGALFASINVLAALGSDETRIEAFRQLAEAGRAQERALDKLEQDSTSDAPADASVQVAGFRLTEYSPTDAVVEVAVRASSSRGQGLARAQTTLTWQDGDWKVVLAPSGSAFDLERIDGLVGFTPWSGT